MEETKKIDVIGMYCAACATRIEKVVGKMDGVTDVRVNLATEQGRVVFQNQKISLPAILERIHKIGYQAKEISQDDASGDRLKKKEVQVLQWKFIISALLTIPLAWAMLSHFKWTSFIPVPTLFTQPLFQLVLTFPIQFVIGFQFYEGAWKAFKARSANMDVLVVLSTSAAFFYSHFLTISSLNKPDSSLSPEMFYETSAFIITFILLGKLLEAKTKRKTTEAMKKLYHLQTKTATLYVNGQESTIAIDQIIPGDFLVIKPGEKVPIDGQVTSGDSYIDESLLTGESIPVPKDEGQAIYAGTINQHGTLKMKVTKRENETALSQIIRIVEDAQTSKALIQHMADKITGVFVPIVITLALITFAAWYFIFLPGEFGEALEKVIAVLIVACPCALGLATPTSMTVGSGQAAQSGILFKEGQFLERLGKGNIMIFDKTGTITKGHPQITDFYVERFSTNAFLEIIGAVEKASNHPLAKAIANQAERKIQGFPDVSDLQNISGYGIEGFVEGKAVVIASPGYFREQQVFLSEKVTNQIQKREQEGKTVMIAMINQRFAGLIAVADVIEPTSAPAITRLMRMGFQIHMLTGDNKNTAQMIAKKTGIPNYIAGVTPQDKAAFIQQLQKQGNRVVMVGDGINDAPALAVADIGVTVESASDIAIESGDISVINGGLNRVVEAVLISKKTTTNIKQNFLWAFLYNLMMIPVAMLGFLAPWFAGAAMAFSSVSVVLNSLRLKHQLK